MTDKSTLSRRQKRAYNDTARDLAAVLDTPQGSRFVRWVLERCGVFLSAQSGQYDPGRREMGLELIRAMDAISPHAFVQLMQDGANETVEHLSAQRRKDTDDED